MNIRQALIDVHLNAFALELFAESVLKSPIAADMKKDNQRIRLFFPVNRGDCEGWAGVEFSFLPVSQSELEAELKRAAVEEWEVVKEHAAEIPNERPALSYVTVPEWPKFESFPDASAFIKSKNLPIGWVARKVGG